jgi:transcriptional regulator with XRE-family HTH domain
MIREYQNLEQFYDFISREKGAKTQFVKRVARKLNMSFGAVEKWCKGMGKTQNPKALAVLSEETGIEQENLFKYEEC